jgi:hypothetical protein
MCYYKCRGKIIFPPVFRDKNSLQLLEVGGTINSVVVIYFSSTNAYGVRRNDDLVQHVLIEAKRFTEHINYLVIIVQIIVNVDCPVLGVFGALFGHIFVKILSKV